MVTELLEKYIWLIQTIRRQAEHGITLAQLQDKWMDKFNEEYARRTFNNHREAILEVFNIEIKCNRSNNSYFIESQNNDKKIGGDASWLVDTFSVNRILTTSSTKLTGRISVEEVPSGHIHLTTILEAMTCNMVIKIEYKKYNSTYASIYKLRPFAVKEFEKRWYLIAECLEKDGEKFKALNANDKLRVYGLDRIISVEQMEENFKMKKSFDVDELFATSFGIYLPKEKAKTIRFKTTPQEAHYLKDLPLHKSQKIISQDQDEVIFEIFAVPDKNMLMSFCKYGSNIEVLSPSDVVNIIKEEINKIYSIYNK